MSQFLRRNWQQYNPAVKAPSVASCLCLPCPAHGYQHTAKCLGVLQDLQPPHHTDSMTCLCCASSYAICCQLTSSSRPAGHTEPASSLCPLSRLGTLTSGNSHAGLHWLLVTVKWHTVPDGPH